MQKRNKILFLLSILIIPFITHAEEIEVKYPIYINDNFKIETNKGIITKYQWINDETYNNQISGTTEQLDSLYSRIDSKEDKINEYKDIIKDLETSVNTKNEALKYVTEKKSALDSLSDKFNNLINNPMTSSSESAYNSLVKEYMSFINEYNSKLDSFDEKNYSINTNIKYIDYSSSSLSSINNYTFDMIFDKSTNSKKQYSIEDLWDIIRDNRSKIPNLLSDIDYDDSEEELNDKKEEYTVIENEYNKVKSELDDLLKVSNDLEYRKNNRMPLDSLWKETTDGNINEIPKQAGKWILCLNINNGNKNKTLSIVYDINEKKDDLTTKTVIVEDSKAANFLVGNSTDAIDNLNENNMIENNVVEENPNTGTFIKAGSVLILIAFISILNITIKRKKLYKI